MINQLEDKMFKNSNNVLFLRELFFETAANRDNVIYTLKREDHEVDGMVYQSLLRLYLETNDTTEYQFACRYLDSWDHWQTLTACSWFKPYVARWRQELEVSQRSIALSKIMEASKGTSRDAFVAAKYIAEGWDKPKTGRGRPSKEEISKAAHDIASINTRESSDYLRLVKE